MMSISCCCLVMPALTNMVAVRSLNDFIHFGGGGGFCWVSFSAKAINQLLSVLCSLACAAAVYLAFCAGLAVRMILLVVMGEFGFIFCPVFR